MSIEAIGRMSCNPAIGGLSKGNIVREIDALGGEMGKLIDASMIQFRILNMRRGPAVQAPRAQADKYLYASLARITLEKEKNLHILQDTVTDLIIGEGSEKGRVIGVRTERGQEIRAGVTVLTTGTFMEANVFIGSYKASSGRLWEPAAAGLGSSLRRLGFATGRLKTSTPARVSRLSIDADKMQPEFGDNEVVPFSFSHLRVNRPAIPCYITYTNRETHKVIRDNTDRSPIYSGEAGGAGPRYCPSIEDKVMNFPDRDRHQVFVEPEGIETREMYLNGLFTSLPEDVQKRFIRTIPGLEYAEIVRPGYAVEYDFVKPTQLFPSLETKLYSGLFIAGQTNGSSGYEEAACQGLVAGINAALYLQRKPPLILSRSEAYTGVLIDDLVTLGTEEPYRMFTSRAEYRLNLRHDSSDMRLMPYGIEIGLQGEEARNSFERKKQSIDEIKALLGSRRIAESELHLPDSLKKFYGKTLDHVLKTGEVLIEELVEFFPDLGNMPREWLRQAALDIRYEGYIRRQEQQIARLKKLEKMKIPADFDYENAEGLSNESKEKLKAVRPVSIAQASRVSGVRNGDIAILMVHLSRETMNRYWHRAFSPWASGQGRLEMLGLY